MHSPTYLVVSLLVNIACLFHAGLAIGQTYPSKSIRLIVPNTPGSGLDIAARVVSPEMSIFLGQPVVVENKSGASGVIGYEYVAKQVPADGYTAVTVFVPGLATLPMIFKDLRFDPLKDLPPIIGLVESTLVLATASRLPWKTFEQLVTYAKANPGKLNHGASTTALRLAVDALAHSLGLDIVFIPYPAGAAFYQGLASGDVQLGLIAVGSVSGLGVRPLAITGQQRNEKFPDVPTFSELGHPEIRGSNISLNVRAGTPRAVTDKLYAAAAWALQQPRVKTAFMKSQHAIDGQPPEAAAKSLAEMAKMFSERAQKLGIQPE